MEKKGIFTFTTGEPIRLKGFSDGAAVSWSQEKGVREQIKNEIESMFDVFCDGTYPYEDYYKCVETGFLQGITDAETVNETAANWAGLEVVAELSALHRLDLDQDEGKIRASYLDVLKDYPSALQLLSQAGVALDREEKLELAASHDQTIQTTRPKNHMISNFLKGSA